jgi:hypothetical protein
MNPFSNLMQGWAQKRYRKEAVQLLNHLRSLDDKSIGLVLAIAAHHRNALIKEGVAMRDLTTLAREAPLYQHDLAKAVNVLARKKRPHDALGLQIWVHSLRAVSNPDVHDVGVDIWRELVRGQPHVASARKLVNKETGFELDIAMAGEVPQEFAAKLNG